MLCVGESTVKAINEPTHRELSRKDNESTTTNGRVLYQRDLVPTFHLLWDESTVVGVNAESQASSGIIPRPSFNPLTALGDRNQGANSDRDTNSDSNRVRRNDANRAYAGYHAGERHTYPELFKWGIKYDDTAKTMLVEDFIFRVEKLQRSYNCPWEVIMDGFHHLWRGRQLNDIGIIPETVQTLPGCV
ncbi:hypothetical protein EVAR_101101_1 [Eumeta japonica]|uniref:Uncharacterized protein n=1 Tax=Eumeta variegata TaxID=151549 RepID=A0A4C1TJ86_EUMVA|nr:hypothetical protein EVAR_101101_1 [Eumeta japonica]